MKTCTCCKQAKPRTEFGPYRRAKDGLFAHCKQCVRDRANAWRKTPEGRARALATDRARTPAKVAKQRVRRQADPEATRRADAARYAKHRNRVLAAQRERYHANLEASRAYQVAYRKARPELSRDWYARRRAAKLQATPAWADLALVAKAYEAADFLMMVTGDWYEVDHIVPLRGAIGRKHVVCGLHVSDNLQVLPMSENRRKSNVYWPGMPGA